MTSVVVKLRSNSDKFLKDGTARRWPMIHLDTLMALLDVAEAAERYANNNDNLVHLDELYVALEQLEESYK